MTNKKEWQISLGLVCMLLGFLLVVQFRTQANVEKTLFSSRLEELSSMLKDTEKEKTSLEKEVKDLRLQIEKYEECASKEKSLLSAMNEELEKVRLVAGLTEVQGPGVVVYMEDSKIEAKPGEDLNLFLIHEEDLLKVVNELFAAGAEAIALNGQRIIATTEIRCVGNTIMVNGTRTASPYEIFAIGNPKNLESALNMRGGVVEMFTAIGIKIKVIKQKKIIIPAYVGSVHCDYAKAIKEEKK